MKRSVMLLGSYGQSNLGDDLLMWNYLKFLQDQGFTKIYVNANTTELIPKPIKKAYPDLEIIDTYNTSILEYVRFIKKVDSIVYGGGTLYKELYASTGRSKYSVIVRMMGFNLLAKLFGVRLYHLNIGIGSLKTWLGRTITRIALSSATQSIFRDQKSYDFAKNVLHIPESKIALSTDGLFLNQVWKEPWQKAKLRIDRKKYKNIVGVNILSDIPDWIDRDHYIQVMQKFVTELLDQGSYVVLVPFQHAFNPHNDQVFMQDVFDDALKDRKGYKLLEEVPIDLVSSYLQQCDIFIGMRFHSLLLAAVNRIPFVAVAYDTKCWRFIEEIDYKYATELEKLEYADLMRLYETAFASRKKVRQQLDGTAKQLYAGAEEGLRALNL